MEGTRAEHLHPDSGESKCLHTRSLKRPQIDSVEANIIGNGGFGIVYRGVLSDGTLAAIKMLHREGKQGERAFRIEVTPFIYYSFSLICFFLALSSNLGFCNKTDL
jgi:hypothetical protein